jgi:hypothetical protein
MHVTTFYTTKAGQGCTTVAAAAALVAAKVGPTILVSPGPDAAAVLGIATPDTYPVEVTHDLALVDTLPEDIEPGTAVIIDAGTNPEEVYGVAYLVTRPCYLALRRTPLGYARRRPDGIVLITEPGRALTASDVATIIGAPIRAELAQDPAVARAIDAGLLAHRLPRTLARAVGRLVEPAAVEEVGA